MNKKGFQLRVDALRHLPMEGRMDGLARIVDGLAKRVDEANGVDARVANGAGRTIVVAGGGAGGPGGAGGGTQARNSRSVQVAGAFRSLLAVGMLVHVNATGHMRPATAYDATEGKGIEATDVIVNLSADKTRAEVSMTYTGPVRVSYDPAYHGNVLFLSRTPGFSSNVPLSASTQAENTLEQRLGFFVVNTNTPGASDASILISPAVALL